MKLLWNDSLNNKDFAGNHGKFVFQNNTENTNENESITIPFYSNATTNPAISQTVENYTQSISNQIGIGEYYSTNSVDTNNVWSNYIPPRTDGFFSQSAQQFWRVDVQLIKRLFPERHLSNDILASLEGLNISNQNAIGQHTNVFNALHQQLEPSINYIRNGQNIDQASYLNMDMTIEFTKAVDDARQQRIKEQTKIEKAKQATKSGPRRFLDNLNPLNWTTNWQLNKSSENNPSRSKLIAKNLTHKAEGAKKTLAADVKRVGGIVNAHLDGWHNRYENDQTTLFYNFVQDVLHNPNGFINNNGFQNNYNFADIFGTNSRVRVLDVLVTEGYLDQAVEFEKANQWTRDMTANLSNLNTREVNVENSVNNLEDTPLENLFDNLPDPVEETTAPKNEVLFNSLSREIIRVERQNNPNFNINEVIFGMNNPTPNNPVVGVGNKMRPSEKLPYLFNYIIDPQNIGRFLNVNNQANFAGFDRDKARELKKWINQYRDPVEETKTGLDATQWAELQTNSINIITDARTALTRCNTLSGFFTPTQQSQLPTELAPIKSFITSFELFNFETTIKSIPDTQKGIFTGFQNQITVIKNTLSKMVEKIETTLSAENTRMSQPIPGSNPPAYPNDPADRRDLSVSVSLTLNQSVDNLLTNLNTQIQAHNHPGQQNNNIPVYDRLRVHLSNEAKKSRENQFTTDITCNSTRLWSSLRNAGDGAIIPLMQGERDDYTSHTLNGLSTFNNFRVVDNRVKNGIEELVLHDENDEFMYILRPEGDQQNTRIKLYQLDLDPSQYGLNVPKDTVSIDISTAIFNVYTAMTVNNSAVHANPLLNAS